MLFTKLYHFEQSHKLEILSSFCDWTLKQVPVCPSSSGSVRRNYSTANEEILWLMLQSMQRQPFLLIRFFTKIQNAVPAEAGCLVLPAPHECQKSESVICLQPPLQCRRQRLPPFDTVQVVFSGKIVSWGRVSVQRRVRTQQ